MSKKKLARKYNVEIIRAKDGFSIAKKKETELHGLLSNDTGEIIIPFEYQYLDVDFSKSELVVAENQDGFYGFINRKNEVIIPFQYQFASNFRNGFSYISRFVEQNGLGIEYQGVIDEKGNIIFPMDYENIYLQIKQNCVLAKTQGKWGIMTFTKDIILPFEFEEIESLLMANNDFYICTQNNKIGLFNIYTKEFIIPVQLDGIEESFYIRKGYKEFGYCIFTKNNLQALVKIEDNDILFLTEYIYDFIDHINCFQGRVRINQNGLWGIADTEGKVIIPCKYDTIYFNDTRIKAKKGKKEYVFNLNGNLII